jgi:hypothetical protein
MGLHRALPPLLLESQYSIYPIQVEMSSELSEFLGKIKYGHILGSILEIG